MSGFTSAYLSFIDPLNLVGGKTAAKAISGGNKPKPQLPVDNSVLSPKAAEDTTLKPGQKTNLINTSPQGVLEPATSNRTTLLGG